RAARNDRELKRETLVRVARSPRNSIRDCSRIPPSPRFSAPMLCPSANSARGRLGKVGGLQDVNRENPPIGYIPSFPLWSGRRPSYDRERKGARQDAANRSSI